MLGKGDDTIGKVANRSKTLVDLGWHKRSATDRSVERWRYVIPWASVDGNILSNSNPYDASTNDAANNFRRKMGAACGAVAFALGAVFVLLMAIQTVGVCHYVSTMKPPTGEFMAVPLVGIGMVSFLGTPIIAIPIVLLFLLASKFSSASGVLFARCGLLCLALPIPIFVVGAVAFLLIFRARGF
jgi:hypothetical protein